MLIKAVSKYLHQKSAVNINLDLIALNSIGNVVNLITS